MSRLQAKVPFLLLISCMPFTVGEESIKARDIAQKEDDAGLLVNTHTISPHPSSILSIRETNSPIGSNDDEDSDSDSDSAAYVSFSDSESDPDEEDLELAEQRKAEELEREAERARVLEAAGLVVQKDPTHAPPVPPHRRRTVKTRTRRAPPPVPKSTNKAPPIERDLPPTPSSPHGSFLASEADAYDKYESYRRRSSHHGGANRFSLVSVGSTDAPSSPASTTPPILSSISAKDSESHVSRLSGSALLNFLGRSTSQASVASERKAPLVISAPVPANTEGAISRGNSPAFGMVTRLVCYHAPFSPSNLFLNSLGVVLLIKLFWKTSLRLNDGVKRCAIACFRNASSNPLN